MSNSWSVETKNWRRPVDEHRKAACPLGQYWVQAGQPGADPGTTSDSEAAPGSMLKTGTRWSDDNNNNDNSSTLRQQLPT